jgi:rhomboid protease GluP
MIYATRRSTTSTRGWIWVSGFVLAVTAVMSYLNSSVGGLIGGCLWAVLIMAPLIGSSKVNQLVAQQRYGQASRLAAFVCLLHPADGWREQPALLRALEMAQRGAMDQAIAILDPYKTSTTPIGRVATATLYRMGARWEDLLVWIRENVPEAVLQQDVSTMSQYLRALGETGELNGLLQALDRFEPILEKTGSLMIQNLVRLFAFAFCGKKEQVIRLLYGPLAMYPQHIRQFWLATAELAAGNEAVAREQLLSIRNSSDIPTRNAVEWRLSQPQVDPEAVLTEKSRQILSRLSTELEQEARYSGRTNSLLRKANATYVLIGLNLLAFALEVIFGGSENLYTLYYLGALIPSEVVAGAWWRLLTSTFLHFGFLHLLMNMLALYSLGPFVEFALGVRRYVLTYFTAGVGSMLVVSVLAVMGYSKTQFVVGASGCIMALIGATAAILLRGWRREKSRFASKRLRVILFIIAFQVVFDLSTPQISFIGHTAGVIIGFLVGSLLKHDWEGRQ